VITLGAVIRGDTGHYEVVAGECARGVQDVQLRSGVPGGLWRVDDHTVEQALERSLPDETNKGREAALTRWRCHSASSRLARALDMIEGVIATFNDVRGDASFAPVAAKVSTFTA